MDEITATAIIVPAPPYPGATPGPRALITDGPHAGTAFCMRGPTARIGETVTVRFHPQDQFCTLAKT